MNFSVDSEKMCRNKLGVKKHPVAAFSHHLVFDAGGYLMQRFQESLKSRFNLATVVARVHGEHCFHAQPTVLWSRAPCKRGNVLSSGQQGQHGWMLSLDESFIHRTNMITRSGFEFIGIYLGRRGVQWASTVAGKHTPRCKGAAKTDHGGKQRALEPADIYWPVPHTVLVTLLSTRGWLMTRDHVNFSHHLQMCM